MLKRTYQTLLFLFTLVISNIVFSATALTNADGFLIGVNGLKVESTFYNVSLINSPASLVSYDRDLASKALTALFNELDTGSLDGGIGDLNNHPTISGNFYYIFANFTNPSYSGLVTTGYMLNHFRSLDDDIIYGFNGAPTRAVALNSITENDTRYMIQLSAISPVPVPPSFLLFGSAVALFGTLRKKTIKA